MNLTRLLSLIIVSELILLFNCTLPFVAMQYTNHQLVDMIQDLQDLNSQILINLERLDPTQHKAYIVNTGIVARQRMDVVSALIPQLDKNPNKVGKVVKRVLDEIQFGGGSSLDVLIQQARDELNKIEIKLVSK